MRQMGEQALKLEDKTLPQLAQNWARISRNLSGKLDPVLLLIFIRLWLIVNPFISAHLNNQDKEWFTEFYFRLTSLGTSHQHQTIQEKPHVILSNKSRFLLKLDLVFLRILIVC